jgi:hypothetical protein
MYVYMLACVCVCIYIYIYTLTLYIYIYTLTHKYTHTHTNTYTSIETGINLKIDYVQVTIRYDSNISIYVMPQQEGIMGNMFPPVSCVMQKHVNRHASTYQSIVCIVQSSSRIMHHTSRLRARRSWRTVLYEFCSE